MHLCGTQIDNRLSCLQKECDLCSGWSINYPNGIWLKVCILSNSNSKCLTGDQQYKYKHCKLQKNLLLPQSCWGAPDSVQTGDRGLRPGSPRQLLQKRCRRPRRKQVRDTGAAAQHGYRMKRCYTVLLHHRASAPFSLCARSLLQARLPLLSPVQCWRWDWGREGPAECQRHWPGGGAPQVSRTERSGPFFGSWLKPKDCSQFVRWKLM